MITFRAKSVQFFVLGLLTAGFASQAFAQQSTFCGMRDYWYQAQGTEMPNLATVIGGTISNIGAEAAAQAEVDQAVQVQQQSAEVQARVQQQAAPAQGHGGNGSAGGDAGHGGNGSAGGNPGHVNNPPPAQPPHNNPPVVNNNNNNNNTAVDAGDAAAIGGAAIAIIGSISSAKSKSHLMEVYNNIYEALELKHNPSSTDTSALEHTLGIINKMKDPSTNQKYDFTLDELSQAVLNAAKAGMYCGDGTKLLVTDQFRAALLQELINPPVEEAPTTAASN